MPERKRYKRRHKRHSQFDGAALDVALGTTHFMKLKKHHKAYETRRNQARSNR